MDIEERIIDVLKENREGVMIIDIASQIHVHRHTAIKYIYKLIGEGKIKIKKIGVAKLCYLNVVEEEQKQQQPLIEPKKRLPEILTRKVIVLFLLLLFAGQGLLFAQSADFNLTSNDSVTTLVDSEIAADTIFSTTTVTTSTLSSISTITTVSDINENSAPTTTVTTSSEGTETATSLITTVSIDAANEIAFDENIELTLAYPDKATRGEEISINASASVKKADIFNLTIVLPDYIESTAGDTSRICDIKDGETCYLETRARIVIGAVLGINDIKLIAVRRDKT